MIKKILIYIVIVFSVFLFIDSVSAATIDYFSLNNSTDAYFVNCTSKDNCWNYVGATTNTVESVGANSDKIINAWNSPSVTTTGYGLGIGLSFDVNFSFIAGNYYTVSILVEPMSSVATMYTTNSKLVGTGNSSQNAYNNAGYAIEKSEMRDVDVNFGNAVLNNTFTIITYTFQAKGTGRYAYFNFTSKDTITGSWTYYGYTYSDHGSKAPTTEEIEEALQDQFDSLNNSITEGFEDITGAVDGVGDKVQETNDKLDEIKDMDISDEDKELPDDTEFNNYQDAEDDLMDKVNEADMSVLDVAIDVDSSNFVWDTLTDLIQSHTLIFSTIIAILSIGIIKLALGR